MKTSFVATFAATALLAATSAFATPTFDRDHDNPRNRADNYGYARDHRVTREEAARWEAAHHQNDRDDRNQNYGFDRDHRVTRDEQRRWEQAHNYGYAASHRVTPQERARWEANYRR